MSELGGRSAAQGEHEASAERRRRVAAAAYRALLLVGAVLTLIALPPTVVFLKSAHASFWILAALAMVADLRPVRLPPPLRRWAAFVVSMGFCFAILLIWGAAPAIVTQVVAVAVMGRTLQLNWRACGYLTARLVCSFAAAGLVARALGVSGSSIRMPLDGTRVLHITSVALAFLAVSCAISAVGAMLAGATRTELAAQVKFEVLARGTVLVLGSVIAITASAWSLLLLFFPIVGWWELARLLADQDSHLEHDPVTGLLSSYGLDVAIINLPREHFRDFDWFALILVELRGMAFVSRNFGQNAAEHLMMAVTERLLREARPGDLIGRLSDSKFVLLRPDLSGQDPMDGARRLVSVLSDSVETQEAIPFRLDPAVGVAVAPQHGRDLGRLVPHAEAALFDAKLHGRRAGAFAPGATADVDDRVALLGTLNAAVTDPRHASEIVMLYQPQVHIATGRTDSVEALLRWHHPDRGLIPTDELFRIVEPTGVMQHLTGHVLDRVAGQLAEWNHAGLHLRAAVNVSVLDVSTENFDVQVENVLHRHGIGPDQLDLEITERSVIDDPRLLDAAAERIARLGVGLSLDDFGTGFASLRRLRRLPLTEVKIDRSYISKVSQSARDRAMVTAIYELAQVLGLRLVAEGVEDEATVNALAKLDMVIAQGWYYARPMPALQLVEWLQSRHV